MRRAPALAILMASSLAASEAHAGIVVDLSYVDPNSPAYPRFLGWVDTGESGGDAYLFSASEAAYAYRLRMQPQDCQTAVALVQAQVDDANAAIAGGHAPRVASDSYLEVGDMIRDVALTYDWCGAFVSGTQRPQWEAYADQTLFNVWNPDEASWGGQPYPWSGWSIDNPGNNYHYSFLGATMYWGFAANRSQWVDFLEQNKWPPLVAYFAALPGGGSREGTGYGTSHMRLFELYRVWRDNTGEDYANASPHLTDSIDYWVHATVPTLDEFAPIGDQARVSEPVLFDYQRNLVLQARQMTDDAGAKERASRWLHTISVPRMTQGFNFRHDLIPSGDDGVLPDVLYHHATGVGHFFARTDWGTDALWMAFVAGPYTESHAHQDQGAFTLYGGYWLAVTENIWTHSGIEQGTEVHNVLRFFDENGTVRQHPGTTSTLDVADDGSGGLTGVADLTPAFDGDSRIGHWHRTFTFAQRALTVADDYATGSGTQAVFQVNVPEEPVVSGNTVIAGNLRIRVQEPAAASIAVLDWTTLDSEEYRRGYRVDIGGGNGAYRVVLDETPEAADPIFADGFEGG